MGKKKNKNKVSGAVKTATKTEKNLAKKLKKELGLTGEEDISKVIAEIEREEAKRATASEKMLSSPPSPRAYASFTPHPINNELILFGGEYFNGKQTEMYNELLFFNPTNNTWKKVKAPGAPPPRSAHQAVATPANKGELWVFGGEFTSPSETQFYHYKDLWCFSLAERKWEKVVAPHGPSPRSGHRMVLLGRKIFVFGGYTDDGRDCRYYDDLFTFCLDTRTWNKLTPTGRGPCARSACIMLPVGNDSLVVYGGFSRTREGRTERCATHTDAFRLVAKGGGGGDASSGPNWSWRAIGRTAHAPPPRASQAAAYNTHTNRGYVFGGVQDREGSDSEDELEGEVTGELQMWDLETGRWNDVSLRVDQQQKLTDTARSVAVDDCEKREDVTVVTDSVFTMTMGAAPVRHSSPDRSPVKVVGGGPGARMSAALAVQRSILYLYGGVLESGGKQCSLSDLYSLDLHRLNEWKTLIEQPPLPDWFKIESSDSDEGESGDDTDSEDNSESDEK